jgi:hydroxyacylglutathione hydrolase
MTVPVQHTVNTPYMIGPVHFYSGTFSGELVLFDTGPPTEEARLYLQQNIDLEKLKHVLITHCHIDHYGHARWLEEKTDATVYIPYRDHLKLRDHQKRVEQMYTLLRELGFAEKYLGELRAIFDSGSLFPPEPENYKIAEIDLPQHLGIEVHSCPGHSQSDLVYVGEDWLVTGDTLLKGVFQSPLLDVDLEQGGRFKNYAAYCETLVKLATFEGKTVLPGHRKNIVTIRETLGFYVAKLLARVAQLHPYQDETNVLTLVDILLKGRMTEIFHIYLKASEIVFMKDLLEAPELLESALKSAEMFDEMSDLFYSATVVRN